MKEIVTKKKAPHEFEDLKLKLNTKME